MRLLILNSLLIIFAIRQDEIMRPSSTQIVFCWRSFYSSGSSSRWGDPHSLAWTRPHKLKINQIDFASSHSRRSDQSHKVALSPRCYKWLVHHPDHCYYYWIPSGRIHPGIEAYVHIGDFDRNLDHGTRMARPIQIHRKGEAPVCWWTQFSFPRWSTVRLKWEGPRISWTWIPAGMARGKI